MPKAMKKQSFDKKVFLSLIPYTIIGVVFILLYSMSFVRFRKSDLLPAAGLTALFAAFGQLILGPVFHKLSISRLSEKMEYYASGQMDTKERTDLIKELMRFPLHKAAWTELIFLVCTIGVSFAFHALTDFSLRYTYLFLIVSTLSTYIGFIFSLDNTQKLCSVEAEKIAEDGVDTETVDKEHFFGLSLFSLFTLYVFIPMVLCSVFTLLSVIFLKQPRKLIFISITNIFIISSMTLLFFRRIKKNSWTMERGLFDLMRMSGSSTKTFPTDFASEMSYFSYLFNKTILLFRSLINDMSQVNADINESTTALAAISHETDSTSTEQYSTSHEILAMMQELNSSLSEVESKADEVLNVANTTAEQVDGNFETLRGNSNHMKVIKESNGETINGIQSLSNKISNIQDIVNLITAVTAQTKIIAFNAELEANSIGSEGADFQNVATDIRSLADSTIKLTNEIQDSIHDINMFKDNLIKTGKDFIQRINEGNSISEQLEQNFSYIHLAAAETADEAQDIQQSVPQQMESFRQIEQALQDINSRLNELNKSSHKISLSVTNLKQESGNLATMMLNMEGGI